MRYSQSPPGLAVSLAQQDTDAKLVDRVVAASRGRAYRQTGVLNFEPRLENVGSMPCFNIQIFLYPYPV